MKHDERQMHRDVASRFGAAARAYDRHAVVQRQAADRLLDLAEGLSPQMLLDLGCGTGLLSLAMVERWPAAHLTAVDLAPPMVERYRERLPSRNVRAYAADIACLARNPVFDVVASNCVLHWIHPLATGLERAADQTRPGGTVLVSLMLDGTLAELHEARRLAAPSLPAANRMPTGEDAVAAFGAAGLHISARTEETVCLTLPSVRAVFASLRGQGVTGGTLSHGKRPMTVGEMRKLASAYADRFMTSGGVPMSYRIGYYRAEKPT